MQDSSYSRLSTCMTLQKYNQSSFEIRIEVDVFWFYWERTHSFAPCTIAAIPYCIQYLAGLFTVRLSNSSSSSSTARLRSIPPRSDPFIRPLPPLAPRGAAGLRSARAALWVMAYGLWVRVLLLLLYAYGTVGFTKSGSKP